MNIRLFILCLAFQSLADPIAQWGAFEVKVRDQTVAKPDAKNEFGKIYDSLITACCGDSFARAEKWLFPVAGYSAKDMGKGGFQPHIRYGSSPVKGYDFFDGNRHGGHPAYDIFIRDTNQDCLDDRTGKPVAVVAPVDLLVLSVNCCWQPGSEIRGGKYIWALYPPGNLLLYFAHLDTINVASGRRCQAGDTLAAIGRTGKNAVPKRSPTHLHFMALEVTGDSLKPMDWQREISKSVIIRRHRFIFTGSTRSERGALLP
jgi:hypothetical protein